MTEPRTAAGRALLVDAEASDRLGLDYFRRAVLAIEAEAQLIGFDDAWNKAEADSETLRVALEEYERVLDLQNKASGLVPQLIKVREMARAALTPEAPK
jgi:hypothetical protein